MGLLVFTHYRIHPQGDALPLSCIACGQPTLHQHQKVNKWTLICLMLPLKSWTRDVLLCPSCGAGVRVADTLLSVIVGAVAAASQYRTGAFTSEAYAAQVAEPARVLTEALTPMRGAARRGAPAAAAQPTAAGAMMMPPAAMTAPPPNAPAVFPAPPPPHPPPVDAGPSPDLRQAVVPAPPQTGPAPTAF